MVDCKPGGVGYMEDFDKAGGVPVLLKALEGVLDLDVVGVDGKTLGEQLQRVEPPADWQTTIRTLDAPLGPASSLVVLKGSLAPDGAVPKKASSSPHLHKHRGPAVVFDGPDDAARVDDPALAITPEHVLVMRNAGPVAMGMPEAGSMPLPKYLAEQGVKDMVRISDGRMSGTAYGTVVLHVAPEAAVGGVLALVRDGDIIELDVEAGRVDLLVEEEELARRRAELVLPVLPKRGWRRLYGERVMQANYGADLDFMRDDS